MRPHNLGTLALALLLGACQVRSLDLPPVPRLGDAGGDGPGFHLGEDGGPGPGTDGPQVPDVPGDGTPPPPPDAGDPTDGGCTAQVATDPANCGRCGRICSFANAAPLCREGVCQRGDCLPGFVDRNGSPLDGCEYACTATAGGQEVCDDKDNDCDGQVDEETDKLGDLDHCGGCGKRCAFLHAAASCGGGVCALGVCEGGFVNANGMAADGCECQQSNGGTEICDGLDNDCDGRVDDVEDQDFRNDPQNCGGCRKNCTLLPHAAGTCADSGCLILACEAGYHDLDKTVENGCELGCPGGIPDGPEVCDGLDNDCDGKVDTDDDGLLVPPNFCEQRGACAGSAPRCTGGRWLCEYGPDVQTVGPNQIIGNESRCDDQDNDCDGCIDETFPEVGRRPTASGGSCAASAPAACTDSGLGQCQGRGSVSCAPGGSQTVCRITQPGAAPQAETCDGRDNNCDGIVDNGDPGDPARVREPMVAISGGGLAAPVYMYAYEASRPDATAASAGTSVARACARAGVLPWSNVTYPEAVAACLAAGKRLCTEAEWQRACETSAAEACEYAFGETCSTPKPDVCNTEEHDGDASAAGDQNLALPAGALPMCHADWGDGARIHDLTGNLREWTRAAAPGQNPVRGGAFDTVLEGGACRFRFALFDDRFRYGNTGFRCCADAP
jgi:hypothetical protein